MKHITCKDFTRFECDFVLTGSDIVKMKSQIRTHLEQNHEGKHGQKHKLSKLQIREIMLEIDNFLMGMEKGDSKYVKKLQFRNIKHSITVDTNWNFKLLQ